MSTIAIKASDFTVFPRSNELFLVLILQLFLSKKMKKAFDLINSSLTKNAGPTQILSMDLFNTWLKPIHITTYPFIILGVITNILNILVFWRLDFSAVSNISLFSLSVADLVNIVFIANTIVCNSPFYTLEIFMPSAHFSYVANPLHYSVMAFSSLITAVISMERCCCIMLPMKVRPLNVFVLVHLILGYFFLLQ